MRTPPSVPYDMEVGTPPRAMPGEPRAPGLVGVILTISHDTLWLPWHRLAVAMT